MHSLISCSQAKRLAEFAARKEVARVQERGPLSKPAVAQAPRPQPEKLEAKSQSKFDRKAYQREYVKKWRKERGKMVRVPLEPPESIPGPPVNGGKNLFDEELFDLCRADDYRGLYRALIKRAMKPTSGST